MEIFFKTNSVRQNESDGRVLEDKFLLKLAQK